MGPGASGAGGDTGLQWLGATGRTDRHGQRSQASGRGGRLGNPQGNVAIYKLIPYAALQKRVFKKSWDHRIIEQCGNWGFLGDESCWKTTCKVSDGDRGRPPQQI